MDRSVHLGTLGRFAGAGMGVVLVALLGTAMAVELLSGRSIVVIALLGLLIGPFVLILSGNPRLLLLVGLVFVLPLKYSKYLPPILPHMGGEFGYQIELADVLLGVLMLVWFADVVRTRRLSLHIPRASWFWAVLITLAVADVITGPWRHAASMEVVRMSKVLLLFLWVTNNLVRRGHLQYVALAIGAGCLLQSLVGSLQYFFNFEFGLSEFGEGQDVSVTLGTETANRVGALLGHPNLLSGYLAMVLPLSLAMLFVPARGWLKLFSASVLCVGATVLVLTRSRNGWVSTGGALVVVLVLAALHPGIWKRRRGTFLVVLTLIGLFLLSSSQAILRRFQLSDPTALNSRWIINAGGWEMVKMKPVFGFGKNSYAFEMATRPDLRPFEPNVYADEIYGNPASVPPIHNIYLQQWVEQGTVGLIFFLLTIGAILSMGLRNLKIRDEFMYAVNAGCLAGLLAILVHGLADWVIWWPGSMRLFWFLAGVVAALNFWRLRNEVAPCRAAGAGELLVVEGLEQNPRPQ